MEGAPPAMPKKKKKKAKKAPPAPPKGAGGKGTARPNAAPPAVPKRRASVAPGGAAAGGISADQMAMLASMPEYERGSSESPPQSPRGATRDRSPGAPPVPRRRQSVSAAPTPPSKKGKGRKAAPSPPMGGLQVLEEGDDDDEEEESKLKQMTVRHLRERAAKDGVDAALIEDARDGLDPQGALIKLIKQKGAAAKRKNEMKAMKQQMLQMQKEMDEQKKKQRADRAGQQRAVQEAERKGKASALGEGGAIAEQWAKQNATLSEQLAAEQEKERGLEEALERIRENLDAERKAASKQREKLEEKARKAGEGSGAAAAEWAKEKARLDAEIEKAQVKLEDEMRREGKLEAQLAAEMEKEKVLEEALAEEKRLHENDVASQLAKLAEMEDMMSALKLEAATAAKTAPAEGVPPRKPGEYRSGDIVDVDTEDGMEMGALVLGLPEGGDPGEMRVKFGDGVIDDWPLVEFCNVRTQEEERQRKIAVLEKKAAALEAKTNGTAADEESSSEEESSGSEEEDEVVELPGAGVVEFEGWLQQKPSQPPKKLASGKKADKERERDKRWIAIKQDSKEMLIGADKAAPPTTIQLTDTTEVFFSQSIAGGVLIQAGAGEPNAYFIAPFDERDNRLEEFSTFLEALFDAGCVVAGGFDPPDLSVPDPRLTYNHKSGSTLPLTLRAPSESEADFLEDGEFTGEGTKLALGARVKIVGGACQKQNRNILSGMYFVSLAGKPVMNLPFEACQMRVNTLLAKKKPFSLRVGA